MEQFTEKQTMKDHLPSMTLDIVLGGKILSQVNFVFSRLFCVSAFIYVYITVCIYIRVCAGANDNLKCHS